MPTDILELLSQTAYEPVAAIDTAELTTRAARRRRAETGWRVAAGLGTVVAIALSLPGASIIDGAPTILERPPSAPDQDIGPAELSPSAPTVTILSSDSRTAEPSHESAAGPSTGSLSTPKSPTTPGSGSRRGDGDGSLSSGTTQMAAWSFDGSDGGWKSETYRGGGQIPPSTEDTLDDMTTQSTWHWLDEGRNGSGSWVARRVPHDLADYGMVTSSDAHWVDAFDHTETMTVELWTKWSGSGEDHVEVEVTMADQTSSQQGATRTVVLGMLDRATARVGVWERARFELSLQDDIFFEGDPFIVHLVSYFDEPPVDDCSTDEDPRDTPCDMGFTFDDVRIILA